MRGWNAKEHLGLTLSMAGALVVTIRVASVAGWDFESAAVIAQKQGTAGVLTGLLFTALPALSLAAAAAWFYMRTRSLVPVARWEVLIPMAGLCSEALFFLWPLALLQLAIAAVVGASTVLLLRGLAGRRPARDVEQVKSVDALKAAEGRVLRERRRAVLAAMSGPLVVALALMFSPDPWLPAEGFGHGHSAYAGYLIGSDQGHLYVLVDSPRIIKVVDSSTPHSYCVLRPRFGVSTRLINQPAPLGLLVKHASYPYCPK